MADKEKKEIQQPNALARFFRETRGELGKVVWPTREDALRLTGIVLAVMVFTAVLLFVFDYISYFVISLILGI